MDKYNHIKRNSRTRSAARRSRLRPWIIGSAVVAVILVAVNIALLFSSNFPGQTIVSATGRSVDFTDFLFVTAAPLFLWVFGFNTWSVWSISQHSARIEQILSRDRTEPLHDGHAYARESGREPSRREDRSRDRAHRRHRAA